jgi:Zn-dependent protease
MDQQEVIFRLITWTLLVVSLTVHEWAHAWSAYKLGDDTAAMLGRMSFNPLVHLDMVGTVILPLLGAPIGWAKPVPIQPHRFRRDISMSWGMLLTAIAGPISNIVLAMLGVLLFAGSTHLAAAQPELFTTAAPVLSLFILMNLGLAVFNMLPIPPLDGSRVLNHFMPSSLRPAWEQFEEFSFYILLGVLIWMRYSHTDILSGPILWLYTQLFRLASPLMAG